MHIVTKFLVVLVAVLGVLLSGLSVAYTANADRLASENGALRNQIDGLRASLDEDEAQLAAERLQFKDLLSGKDAELVSVRSELDRLRSEAAQLRTDNTQLKLAEGLYVAQIDEFNATLGTYAQLDQQQSAELAELRKATLQANQREIELVNVLGDRTTEIEVLTENNRALQVQVARLVEERDRAGSGQASAGRSGQQVVPRVPPSFRGRVTDVQSDATGRVLVAIDAGTSDQLAERMELMIVRGSQFIGKVRLQRVDVNESDGVWDNVGRTGYQVREGDGVRPTI